VQSIDGRAADPPGKAEQYLSEATDEEVVKIEIWKVLRKKAQQRMLWRV